MNFIKRKMNFLFLIPITVAGFFVFNFNDCLAEDSKNNNSDESKIIINELLPDPEGKDSEGEFIELYNLGPEEVNLENWRLEDKSGKKYIFSKIILVAEDYLVIKYAQSKIYLNNSSEETVFLYSDEDTLVDSVNYKKASKHKSYSLDTFDTNEWQWSEYLTPGEENEFEETEEIDEIIENSVYSRDIYISELYPNPDESPEKNFEFVELFNFGEEEIDLTGWKIEDKKSDFELEGMIKPQEYKSFYKTVTLNNSGDVISLFNPANNLVDKISYEKAREKYSWSFSNLDSLWRWTSLITPNESNQFSKEDMEEDNKDNNSFINSLDLEKDYPDLILSEILPNPSGKEKDKEYIEIFNLNNEEVNLKNWILRDGSKYGKYVFKEDIFIEPQGYLAIYRQDFSFALNNSGGETVKLFNPREELVSEVVYTTSAKTDISYNFSNINDISSHINTWRWSRFLTPGEKNKFNHPPEVKIKIDKKVYKNIYADFSVKIKDADCDDIKVTWHFGDNRKSYKKKTRHKYQKTGEYEGQVKVSDGSEEVIKNFEIKVQKFPRRKLRIVSFMPNPKGKDSELEWIRIENKSKKKVNLKDFKIATGTSVEKLTNHPIYEKVVSKPGKSKIITRDISKFSLPNKKGVIELRYPDGKKAHRVEYEKLSGVKDDEVWEDGVWVLTKTQKHGKHENTEINTVSTEQIVATDNTSATAGLTNLIVNQSKMVRGESFGEMVFYGFKNIKFPFSIETVRAESNNISQNKPVVYEKEHYLVRFWREINGWLSVKIF